MFHEELSELYIHSSAISRLFASPHRQDGMHTTHPRPSRIQQTTRTSDRQHNTTHDHTPQNSRTHTSPQTHLQQTHRPSSNQSTQNNQHPQSPHLDKVEQTQGNHTRHIQSHNQTRTRVCFYHMVTQWIRNKHRQTTDSTKHCC